MRRGEEGAPGRPRHLDDGGRAVAAPPAAVEHAPLGLDRGAERAGDGRDVPRPAERIEQALAAVGHRDLVGRPPRRRAAPAMAAATSAARRRAPELVGRGDQVGHGGRSYRTALVRREPLA